VGGGQGDYTSYHTHKDGEGMDNMFHRTKLTAEQQDQVLDLVLKCLGQYIVSNQITALDGCEKEREQLKDFCAQSFDRLFHLIVSGDNKPWGWEVFSQSSTQPANIEELIQYTQYEFGGLWTDQNGYLVQAWQVLDKQDRYLVFAPLLEVTPSFGDFKKLYDNFPELVEDVSWDIPSQELRISLLSKP